MTDRKELNAYGFKLWNRDDCSEYYLCIFAATAQDAMLIAEFECSKRKMSGGVGGGAEPEPIYRIMDVKAMQPWEAAFTPKCWEREIVPIGRRSGVPK